MFIEIKFDDIYRNYGILHANDLFKFHVARSGTNMSIISCLLTLKTFFLKLARLDLIRLDNPTSNVCISALFKKSACQQSIFFFKHLE